jgi:hypothetical protein
MFLGSTPSRIALISLHHIQSKTSYSAQMRAEIEALKSLIYGWFIVMKVLVQIIFIWIASDLGYYILVSLLGAGSGYSKNPFILAVYYLCWVAFTVYTFFYFYKEWKVVEIRLSFFVSVFLGSIGIFLYITYILPIFPPIHWAVDWVPPSELLTASPWYFLPKSIEIGLQQLLIAAMILVFDKQHMSIRRISSWSAGLFGSIHLLLVLGGSSIGYVALFTVSAVLAGFVFPYIMLQIRNGFLYSFFIHWSFYALVIVLARLLSQ